MFAARARREGALICFAVGDRGRVGRAYHTTHMKAALLLGAVCLATRGAAQQWQPPRACSQTPQNCNFPPRPGVDAICCNFDNAHLQGEFLFETTFEECSFRNAHLEGADLGEAEFAACDLTGAKLDHANLKMAQFDMGGANNAPCTLDAVSAFGANFEEVEIQGDMMSMVSAKNADFTNTNWWKSKMEFIDFTGSTFAYSSVAETQVTSVNYDSVDFTSSTFFKANFDMCSAREATFYGSNMNHVQASQSDFASADLAAASTFLASAAFAASAFF